MEVEPARRKHRAVAVWLPADVARSSVSLGAQRGMWMAIEPGRGERSAAPPRWLPCESGGVTLAGCDPAGVKPRHESGDFVCLK